jgi:zinc/manganese transport system substrate-binding protein
MATEVKTVKLVKLIVFSILIMPLAAQAKLNVFACEPEWAALAGELGGKHVKVSSATQAMQDPHYIQARPSLIARIRKADLLVCTGAGLEAGWLPVLLRKANNPLILPGRPGHLVASQYVVMKDVPRVVDRSMGDIHADGNPHIQTDPRNVAKVAAELSARLIEIDGGNQEEYLRLYQEFNQRWSSALDRWQQQADGLRGMPVVVYHRSWVYLEEWLGLREVAALEPKPGIPPGSGHLAAVLEAAAKEGVETVIYGQYQDPKSVDWFSERSGIPATMLPTTVGGTAAATDLTSWFDDILNRLLAVKGKSE